MSWAVQPLKRHARLLTEKTDRRDQAVGDFLVMRPAKTAESRFLAYQLRSREVVSIIDGSTFGSKMPRASWDFVGSMPAPLPPVGEQVSIVAFLDRETAKIDALVEEQRRLIELLKEKRQAVISRAVTKGLNPNVPMKDSGAQWLGKVPAHWDAVALKRISPAQTVGIVVNPSTYVASEGLPFLYGGDIREWRKPKPPCGCWLSVDLPSSPPPSPARSTCAAWCRNPKAQPHEHPQGSPLRGRDLRRPSCRRLAATTPATPPATTAQKRCSSTTWWPGSRPASPRLGDDREEPRRLGSQGGRRAPAQGTGHPGHAVSAASGLRHDRPEAPISMCQFKPALAMNADLQARYAANRLRVVRQVRYSVHHENSIDLVLFVNGIPVATCELKSHYTQSVQDAIYQYKTDREPFFKPKNAPSRCWRSQAGRSCTSP
jgi:hypothetical protein